MKRISMLAAILAAVITFFVFCRMLPRPVDEAAIMIATAITATIFIVTYLLPQQIFQYVYRKKTVAKAQHFWVNFIQEAKLAEPGRYTVNSEGHMTLIHKQ